MSSCINKKTVHKQGVKWADWLFRMSKRPGRQQDSVSWTVKTLLTTLVTCDEKRCLRPNLVKVINAHSEKSSAANVSPPVWKSCFSSKTFWNYETSHQIRMDDKKPFRFVSTKNKCKFFNPIVCTYYSTLIFFEKKKKAKQGLNFLITCGEFLGSERLCFFFPHTLFSWKLN